MEKLVSMHKNGFQTARSPDKKKEEDKNLHRQSMDGIVLPKNGRLNARQSNHSQSI